MRCLFILLALLVAGCSRGTPEPSKASDKETKVVVQPKEKKAPTKKEPLTKEERGMEIRAEVAVLNAKVRELEKELAALALPSEKYAKVHLPPHDLRVGDKGILYASDSPITARIDTIIDADNMLITFFTPHLTTFWLKAPTRNRKADDTIDMTNPIHVAGTKTHGDKTFLYLETIR